MDSRRRTSTVRQNELLLQFAEANKDLALGRLRSKEARAVSAQLWQEAADILNTEGPARLPKEWAKVWNDLKSRVRAKLISCNQNQQATEGGQGGPSTNVTLTFLEGRVAALLGQDVGFNPNIGREAFTILQEKPDCQSSGEKPNKSNEREIIFDFEESGEAFEVQEQSEDSSPPGSPLDATIELEEHDYQSKNDNKSKQRATSKLSTKSAKLKPSILQQVTSVDDVRELVQLKKTKTEVEIELMREKVEIAKREKYKLDLELMKLERDLGIGQSAFTASYSSTYNLGVRPKH